MHASTTYIKDLRERVQQLKQRRDHCYAKIQQASSNDLETTATPGSCSRSPQIRVQFDGAAEHFDVNLTTSSESRVELYMVIRAIEEDGCVEIVEASSCSVEDDNVVHLIKCRARSFGVALDVSEVETRIKRLFMAPHAKPQGLGA
uniref:BHLH domain-containing protein n=1 Tax=Oryza meridionalis TaxID=40149 RepID=A0A0E0E223_9ORYZ